ncbi:hypothetical protein MSA92_00740 [bacterium]|nr:hypothetical protein [bacterium]MDY2884082.1 hypothetical protein [Bariatricus sp.]
MKIEELLKSIDYKVIDEDDDFKIFKIAAKRHMLYLERKDNVFSLERDLFDVSAKYSCGFSKQSELPIIVDERYLDYFTTIMEDRLWQVLAKPAFQCRNNSGLSMNAGRAA